MITGCNKVTRVNLPTEPAPEFSISSSGSNNVFQKSDTTRGVIDKPVSHRTTTIPHSVRRLTPHANALMLERATWLQETVNEYELFLYREGFAICNQSLDQQEKRYKILTTIFNKFEEKFEPNSAELSYSSGYILELCKVGRCDDFCYLAAKKWVDNVNRNNQFSLKLFEYRIGSTRLFDNHFFLLIEPLNSSSPRTKTTSVTETVSFTEMPDRLRGGLIVDLFLKENVIYSGSVTDMNQSWNTYLYTVCDTLGHPKQGKITLIKHFVIDNNFSDEQRLHAKKVTEQLLISYILNDLKAPQDACKMAIDLKKLKLLPPSEHCRDDIAGVDNKWTTKLIRKLIKIQQTNRKRLKEEKLTTNTESSPVQAYNLFLEDVVGLVFSDDTDSDMSITSHPSTKRTCLFPKNTTSYYLKAKEISTNLEDDHSHHKTIEKLKIPTKMSHERIKLYVKSIDVKFMKGDQIKDNIYYNAEAVLLYKMIFPNLKLITAHPDDASVKDRFMKNFFLTENQLNRWLCEYDKRKKQSENIHITRNIIINNMGFILQKSIRERFSYGSIARSLSLSHNRPFRRDKIGSHVRYAIKWMEESIKKDNQESSNEHISEIMELFGITAEDIQEYPKLYMKNQQQDYLFYRRKRTVLNVASQDYIYSVEDVRKSPMQSKKKLTSPEIRGIIATFLEERATKTLVDVMRQYHAEKKAVTSWYNASQKLHELLHSRKQALSILEKLSKEQSAFLKTLFFNYPKESMQPYGKEFEMLLVRFKPKEKCSFIANKMQTLCQHLTGNSLEDKQILRNIGFSEDEIKKCQEQIKSHQTEKFIKRAVAKTLLETLLDPKQSLPLEAAYEKVLHQHPDVDKVKLTFLLYRFKQKCKAKTPEELAQYYQVSVTKILTWKETLDKRNEQIDSDLKLRKLNSNSAVTLQPKKRHMVDKPTSLITKRRKIDLVPETKQLASIQQTENEGVKLNEVQFLDEVFGKHGQPLSFNKYKYLKKHSNVAVRSVDRWFRRILSNFKNKTVNEIASYYKVSLKKASTWLKNKDNYQKDDAGANRKMLWMRFVTHSRQPISQIVSSIREEYRFFSQRQAKKIILQWRKDIDVKQKNIPNIQKKYGFSTAECKELMASYHSCGLSNFKLDYKASGVQNAIVEVLDTLYSSTNTKKDEAIKNYLKKHSHHFISRRQLAKQIALFEQYADKKLSAEDINSSMGTTIEVSKINLWLKVYKAKQVEKEEKFDRKIILFDEMWRDGNPRLISDVAREIDFNLKQAQNMHAVITKAFKNNIEIETMSKKHKIPCDKLANWKKNWKQQDELTKKDCKKRRRETTCETSVNKMRKVADTETPNSLFNEDTKAVNQHAPVSI